VTDKRVGVRIDVGVDGKKEVQDLNTGLDGLSRGATSAGQAGKVGAAGTRELGQAAQAAATGAAQADKAVAGMGNAAQHAENKLGATRRGLESISTQLAETQRGLSNMRDQLIAGFSFAQFVQAAAQMEQVQAGLQAVSGDGKLAGEQMEFVRRMAQAAGVDVTAAGQAFLGLAAATKGTAVEGEPARQVFEAVTLAMAKAGKGSAETQNALLALSQIASKGTVSMEELRGQLGEALPGALQATANGLGITTQDLIKLVESGQLAAEDLFPALAKGLDDLYGGAPAAQTLSQEITNIKNSFVEMAANLGESGGLDALKVGAETAQAAITFLGDTLIQTGQYIGTLAAAVVSMDFSQLSASFAKIEADSRARLLKAAEHNTVLQAALKASGDEATKAALAAQQAGQGHKDAGAAAEEAGGSFAKLAVEYAKARTEAEQQISLAAKEVEAVKARGQAAVAQAAALGDEATKRLAVGEAAAAEATALDKVAQLRVAEVKLLEQERAAKEAALKAAGPISDQRQQELKDLDALIAKKRVEADTSVAQAAASREKAKANSVEAQAAKGLLEEAEALNITRVADAKAALLGLQVQKDLAKQSEELARLMGDERGIREAKILQLEIEIKLVKAKAAVALAEAEGTIAVSQAKIVELQLTGQLTPLKRAELAASIGLAEAKIREARAIGGSTQVLEKQLEALRSGAGAADKAAGSSRGLADANRDLAGGAGGANRVLTEQITLLEGATLAQRRYADALNAVYKAQLELDKYGPGANGGNGLAGFKSPTNDQFFANAQANTDKARDWTYGDGGFVQQNGNRFTAGGQLTPPDNSGDWAFVGDVRASGGGSANKRVVPGQGYWVRDGGGSTIGSRGGATGAGSLGAGFTRVDPTQPADLAALGAAASAQARSTTREDAEQIKAAATNKAAGTNGLSAAEANQVAAANRAAAQVVTRRIEVNLRLNGGGSAVIGVASDADAERLQTFLSQLGRDAWRAA
jgi:tape measure domain-containing protein